MIESVDYPPKVSKSTFANEMESQHQAREGQPLADALGEHSLSVQRLLRRWRDE